ncbi:MAG: 50S ribosomal protein L9 [Bacilli bacterium]|nr:50S ribosomal protein L9 [Bacilli bacterium]
MKVIFTKDVKNQGKAGQIKEVKDGYANNFLIKNNFAVPLNDSNLNKLKRETSIKESIYQEELSNFEKIKKELETKQITFKVKTGEKDKVFGSVSSKQISIELEKMGYKIDKKKIMLNEHLSNLGNHIVNIELHKKVIVNLNIKLEKE